MSNYIFELSDKVTRRSVLYNNRFGIKLAADLYLPKDFDESKRHAAVIIGAPYGGVKEQGSGIYAQNMAERGFVALAFDPSYNGYSGGEPRHLSSPDLFVEDFSAAVDYVGYRREAQQHTRCNCRAALRGVCG
ncbi:alpha/beta hydrolase [Paenibacillus kribbensis]|uniref:alpha/beta hydrolase n=1 Tax=Paenibacillus kribbensis TaxID=172713 RepID=UPI000B167A0F|nr:alpha/beta hydrolase [Paenibacillus kribbensis]